MLNGFGGAIATGFRGATLNGVYHGNYIEDSTFTGNKASYGGGALYNQGNLCRQHRPVRRRRLHGCKQPHL